MPYITAVLNTNQRANLQDVGQGASLGRALRVAEELAVGLDHCLQVVADVAQRVRLVAGRGVEGDGEVERVLVLARGQLHWLVQEAAKLRHNLT